MNLTTVLFDLDGTLLPMDNDAFTEGYFKLLAKKVMPLGYDPAKLVDGVWAGTAAMVKNDGTKSNKSAFWERFSKDFGERVYDDMPVFDAFYENEFQQARAICGFNEDAKKTVEILKEAGMGVALATNPIFPAVATISRIRWAGMEPEDFLLYTTYENTCWCKPNLDYYRDICSRLGVDPRECLMVGNDVGEDMVAEKLGMRVFLLTDCLINRENADISAYPNGGFQELLAYLGLGDR